MRKDFKLNNRATYLPNACTLGFGKWEAKRGDFITFRSVNCDDFTVMWGRVIGRIEEVYDAHTFENPERENIKGWLHVAAMSIDGVLMVRWVDPRYVLHCRAEAPKEILLLLQCDFTKLSEIEKLMSGYVNKFSLGRDPV